MISFVFNNQISEITRLHDLVETYCQERGIPMDIQSSLDLALEEIIANTIMYGYEDDANHEITLTFVKEKSHIKVEIIDDARPFNPLEQAPVDQEGDLEDTEIGGLGIHFVKTLMDQVDYRRENDHNILTIQKNL